MDRITRLSASGEIASFTDDDQFGPAQSKEKCGPEIVALFYHSVAPGVPNPYSATDIHAMASADYVRFIGPDAPADLQETTPGAFAHMLQYHNFQFRYVPERADYIAAWLAYGYPIACFVQESSVYDGLVRSCPYPWNTAGLAHVILATGPATDAAYLKFRDTANIEAPNTLRAGPRLYDMSKLIIDVAILIVPSWLTAPAPGFDPLISLAAPTAEEIAIWQAMQRNIPLNPGAAIFKSWLADLRGGFYRGAAMAAEYVSGDGHTRQQYTAALADYDGHSVLWRA
jgi:hypothetical protein